MKVLSINQSDIDGGAARATNRVASKLLEMNVDIKVLVMRKLGRSEWVIGPKNVPEVIISRLLPRLDLIMKRILGVFTHYSWSLNLFPNFLLKKEFINSFDVIHLNWVGKNMLPINWIRHFKKPVIWTLHDSWAFTGGCHIPYDCRNFENSCGYCPQLNENSKNDISYKMWRRKANNYHNAQFHFVAPSHWIANQAKASSLLKDFPISVIPNGLDTKIYAPTDKRESRKSLNLPNDKRIILFGAMYADTDKNKGMALLLDALNILVESDSSFTKNHLLVIFGTENKTLSEIFPIPVICFGVINNERTLGNIYSSADLTVVPSRSESFGQVASESLSCGTPVVAFNTTGLKDIVDHLETGYLAKSFQVLDLAKGIRLVAKDTSANRIMSVMARQRAVERFDIEVVAKKYLALYEQLLSVNN